ncbi:MAG: DUF169 domain-containing protein [candidate division NC10 bacterium]|nr:DUF169 domain-containing protein [candidate division NC10 bacterium]
MDLNLRDRFNTRWRQYFGEAELPITFYYTDREDTATAAAAATGHRCVVGDLAEVRHGKPLRFDLDSVGCWGGKRYFGFTQTISPTFDYFLSCGIPGKVDGERYKKSPELVRAFVAQSPTFTAPAKFIVFKRWDHLDERDEPAVAIFFARPDVLSGLFTLTNFDETDPNGVFAPFAAGCGSIVQYPYLERTKPRPRAVLGMFDVSARPCVPKDVLSFAIPMPKLERMIADMPESFLITHSWEKVRERLG